MIDTYSDITCWVLWNRLEGVNSCFSNWKARRKNIEGWVCAQVLVRAPSSDFSEEEDKTQLIYSGSVLLDLHPLS